MSFLYKPADAVCADFIPFYWKGKYHLFYLKEYRDVPNHGEGVPWFQLVTSDFVNFEEWGEAVARGPIGAQDVWVFTGCVIENAGTFYLFYTGHSFHYPKIGKPQEAIMLATSPDLKTWTKDPSFTYFPPGEYEQDDWRDPFIYFDPRYKQFAMLLAARKKTGPSRNRGCVALSTSPDLKTWTVRDPLLQPNLYFTHECPDLFQIGDWWYLISSEFSERHITHYRMAKSLDGPWLTPKDDAFDTRGYYAAKSASDGNRRFLTGWLATRDGEKDDGSWQWGGSLVTHEIIQQPDGTLTVQMPDTVQSQFTKPVALSQKSILGNWESRATEFSTRSVGKFSACTLGKLPETCLIETAVTMSPGTVSAGLLLRAGETLDTYYQLRLEPNNHRITFDRWPRPGDQPFMFERPVQLDPGLPVRLKVLVDGTCVVAYINDRVALSCRMYNRRAGDVGLFVTEGDATFDNFSIRTQAEQK